MVLGSSTLRSWFPYHASLTRFPCVCQVDHSIVETFVQHGRTVITSRVYPELALDAAAHVFLFNNGTEPITASAVRAWNMNSIHITQYS